MKKKLKDSSGLTLVEMLCATAILVLLCLMLNSGLSMAIKTYQGITAESETQLLLSSLSGALADKLRYCVVYVNASGEYKSCSIGEIKDTGGRLKATVKEKKPDGTETETEVDLLPEGAYGNPDGFYKGDYQVKTGFTSLKDAYQKDTNSFAIELTVEDVNLGISKTTELTVRCLNPPKEEETEEGTTP